MIAYLYSVNFLPALPGGAAVAGHGARAGDVTAEAAGGEGVEAAQRWFTVETLGSL